MPLDFAGAVLDVAVGDLERSQAFYAILVGRPCDLRPRPDQCEWRLHREPEVALRLTVGDGAAGRSGPLHGIDTEQVWTVLSGGATVDLPGGAVTVQPGDTVVIPADAPRRITADPSAGLIAVVVAPAGMRAYPLDGTVVPPTCAVPDGDKLIPAWVV